MKQVKRKAKTEIIRNYEIAIKGKCYDCMCGSKKIDCEIDDCTLYPYRPFPQNKSK